MSALFFACNVLLSPHSVGSSSHCSPAGVEVHNAEQAVPRIQQVIHAGDMICDGTIKPVPVPAKPEGEGPEVKETTKLPEVPAEGAATTPADGAMAIQPVGGSAQPAEPEIMPAEAPAPSTPRKVCCVLPLLVFEDLHRCCAHNGKYSSCFSGSM